VNILERRVENQVQFWSLLGPFVILLSITILLFKVSSHWVFPVCALIGVPLCVKWKLKGMATALSCLFFLSTVAYFNLEMDERYWHVGMGLAIAFSFIVLTLSLEEVEGLIGQLQLESQSRLENFVRLDEKWKGLEHEWTAEKDKLQTETAVLTRDLTKTQDDKQTFYKLAQLAKDELLQVRTQHAQLVQELLYKKQQIAQLHERLEENEVTIQSFVNTDTEKQLQQVIQNLAMIEKERDHLKSQVQIVQNQIHVAEKEKDGLKNELIETREREKIERYQLLQALQQKAAELEQEKFTWNASKIDLQKQYEQVCQIEAQHRQTVQFHQHCVSELEIQLAKSEKDKNSLSSLCASLQQQYEQACVMESQHQKVIQSQQQRLSELESQLIEVQQEKEEFVSSCSNIKQKIDQFEDQIGRLKQNNQSYLATIDELEAHLQQQANIVQEKENFIRDLHHQFTQLQQSLLVEQMRAKMACADQEQLQAAKQKVEQKFIQVIEQLQSTQAALEEARQQSQASPISQVPRRSEALYLQLREQFQEKSNTLDETRRVLFHTQEQLLALQKAQEEEQLYDLPMNEQKLQRLLTQSNKQHEKLQSVYQQEIHDLYDLVGHLLNKC